MTHNLMLAALRRMGLFILDENESERYSFVMERLGLIYSKTDGESLEDQVHPKDRETFQSLYLADAGEEEKRAEYRIKGSDGEWRWIRTRIVSVKKEGGADFLRIGIDEDVTERKSAEDELRLELEESERWYELAETMRVAELLASASPDLASTVSAVLGQASERIPFIESSVYSRQDKKLELIASFPDCVSNLPRILPDSSSRLWEVMDSKSPLFIGDASKSSRAPRDVCCSWLAVPLIFRGAVLGALEFWIPADDERGRNHTWPAMVFGDMLAVELDAESRRRELIREASTDHLTGLLTRKSFSRIASKLISRFATRGESIALILADIDHFKSFNDRFGHLRGDEVLRGVAEGMKEGLREEDIICRFGGEEFVAFLPGATESIALEVAERLRVRLEKQSFARIGENVTASFGVATCKAMACDDIKDLIEKADRAMYLAKDRGRNCVVLADQPFPACLAPESPLAP